MATAMPAPVSLTAQQVEDYRARGYLIVRGLFAEAQVQALRDHFDELAARGEPIPNHWQPVSQGAADAPLKRYPRVMQPHRFSDLARRMLLHASVYHVLVALLDEEPIACQSMYYFKPPGSKGQALHQDNFYLDVMPGTCVAAWVAIDPATPVNGGLYIVPGTHTLDIQCPEQADPHTSFTTHLVNAPKGFKAMPTELAPGDVLFFNGSVIHGSGPNRSADQWRRSFICHYMPVSSRSISAGYRPVLDFQGRQLHRDASPNGGPCGLEFKPGSYDKVEG